VVRPDPRRSGRTIFIEQHVPLHGVDFRAVVRGRHKVILDFNTKAHEVYDIAADPFEMRNLAGAGLPEDSGVARRRARRAAASRDRRRPGG
jgi:arylsulfatase A-like enzyme